MRSSVKFIFSFILFLGILSAPSVATSPSVSASVSPNAIFIGDIITYSIDISLHKDSLLITVPDESSFADNANLSFIDSRVSKSTDDTLRYISLEYDFQIFDINQQIIPTQHITIQPDTSKAYQDITIPALTLPINSIKPADVMDIQLSDTIFINTNLNWAPILLLIIIIIILGIGIFKLLQRFKRSSTEQTPLAPPIDTRSPFEIANHDLLANFNQLKTLAIKDYYVRYSDIIKTYLRSILTINDIEMTSTEILALCLDRFNEQDYRRIKKLLHFSDSVKFALAPASDDDNQLYYDKAVDCIQAIHDSQSSFTNTSQTTSRPILEESSS
tara:strand:+ start:1929 stop:2918 length:990 start_codon:yes stop_codon:yes gene_type:complete